MPPSCEGLTGTRLKICHGQNANSDNPTVQQPAENDNQDYPRDPTEKPGNQKTPKEKPLIINGVAVTVPDPPSPPGYLAPPPSTPTTTGTDSSQDIPEYCN